MSDIEPASDPNPSPIGGMDSLVNEPTGAEPDGTGGTVDERRFFEVRDVRFHVRPGLPAILAGRWAKAQAALPKNLAEGTLISDLSPAIQAKYSEARAVTYDLLLAAVVADERDDLIEFLTFTEPIVDSTELAEILARAMAAVSGRPTGPS